MIWNVKVACERTQLLELEFINDCVLAICHGQFKFTVLSAAEVLNCPNDLALADVKIGPIRVFLGLLRRHHGLCTVYIAVGVDYGTLDSCDILPRCDNWSASALLVFLVDEDAKDLRRCLEPYSHFLDSKMCWQSAVSTQGQI